VTKVSVNNIELYYEVHGQGYPVVFLHGFSSTHHMWQPQVPALSRDYQFTIYLSLIHISEPTRPY